MAKKVVNKYLESIKHALWYLKRLNFSVIPVLITEDGERVWPVKWKVYQERKPTEAEVVEMFKKHKGANVAAVLGRASGVVVIDVDREEVPPFLERIKTWTVRTKRGFHFYFSCEGETIQTMVLEEGIDLKAEGSTCTLPRSYHHKDQDFRYEWIFPPYRDKNVPNRLAGFSEVRDRLAVYFVRKREREPLSCLYRGVSEGKRNVSLTRIAGSLFADGLSYDEVLNVLLRINECNSPPLPEREVTSIVKSIYSREMKRRKVIEEYKNRLCEVVFQNGFRGKFLSAVKDVCNELKSRGFTDKDVFFFLRSLNVHDLVKFLERGDKKSLSFCQQEK